MRNIYLILAVAFNVASYLVYKSISHKETNNLWYMIFVFGLMLGGINVLFFTKALRELRLSIAYPVFSGGCIFFMVILSCAFFGERMSVVNMIGAFVIVVGIALMSN